MKKFVVQAVAVVALVTGTLAFTGCAKKTSSDKHYTNRSIGASPKSWSPTDWQFTDDGVIFDYVISPFWTYIPNESREGYTVLPLLASALPKDVTADYAGDEKWGIPSDVTTGRAWQISIRKEACWDDGTKITTDDVEYSIQQFLNPEMKNYRASSFYEGPWALVNAKKYYQGSEAYDDILLASGEYADVADSDMYVSLTQNVKFFGDGSVQSYHDNGYNDYFVTADGTDLYELLTQASNGATYFKLTPEVKDALNTISANFGDPRDVAYKEYCFSYTKLDPTPWENVGFVKNDDHTFTLILDNAQTQFFVIYGQSYLVKKDLYEKYKSDVGGIVKSKYGTSVENSASYGPFVIDDFQADKSMHLTRNKNWWGYKMPEMKYFQTTDIDIQFITEHETALNLFLQGKLDSVSLASADMDQYGASEYVIRVPESYTYKYSFNSDRKSLERENTAGINHSVLANRDFRHAISLSLDRQKYVDTVSIGYDAGYGLLNYLYITDPENGTVYRETEDAKKALTEFYGVTDEKDITGYDLVAARKYFTKAYNDELAAGNIKASDRFEFDFHVYATSSAYTGKIQFLIDAINEATAGTPFEGKITINTVGDQNFYDNLKNGAADIAITAWGGSSFDPYGVLWCYCDPSANNEYGFDPEVETLTINVEGKDITKTYYEWYQALCISGYTDAPFSVRDHILASVEKGLLEYYTMIPMAYRTAVSLDSQRIIEFSDHYMNQFVGYGGLYFTQYSMDDAEWDAYCTEQNNQLKY